MRFKQAVAIAGTHGKTTTTSMVAALLDAGGFDPTVINGGIINAYGTNARMGARDWMVVEADESDGTFVKLPADVALVTNIDPEHLDHYGTFDRVREAFLQFVENVPFYGFAVMCVDHPEVQALIGRIEDRRIVTYGASPQADVRYTDLRIDGRRSVFTAVIRDRNGGETKVIENLSISMPGEHNVQNATGALAVAWQPRRVASRDRRGAGELRRRQAPLHPHRRVERRRCLRRLRPPPDRDRRRAEGRPLDRVGPRHRRRPAAPLHAAPRSLRPVLLLLQRRRHGHRRAGLSGRRGADPRHRPRRAGQWAAACAATATSALSTGPTISPRIVAGIARPGDFVVCLGAGSISQWAYALPGPTGGARAGNRAAFLTPGSSASHCRPSSRRRPRRPSSSIRAPRQVDGHAAPSA